MLVKFEPKREERHVIITSICEVMMNTCMLSGSNEKEITNFRTTR